MTVAAVSPSVAQATKGAAQWLAESQFVASSMETGRIGYLEAWGGDEFGYSYTYALSGQPTGLTVDAESGMLLLASALKPGAYPFSVTVSNRRDPSKTARFKVTLAVRQGVTGHRSGSQILHKVYDVDDRRFGTPIGSDYTRVLMNIRRLIVVDQAAAGDGNLRATVRFAPGKLYQYANNRWPWSGQYVNVETVPSIGRHGGRARLQCTGRTGWNSIQGAAIRVGRNWGYYYYATDEANLEDPKRFAYPIYTTTVGTDRIRLKNAADGKNLKPGRYHMVISYDQQMYGFPPNARYFEYVKVAAVSGDQVTLDRRLRHIHRDDYLEVGDPNSLGRARIVVLDRGGHGGVDPGDHRWLLRSIWRDIEFLPNPWSKEEQAQIVEQEGGADIEFVDCILPALVPSNVRHARLSNCQVGGSEGDKQIGMFLMDQTILSGMTECTSFDLLFLRDTRVRSLLVMPRQFRAQRCTIDSTEENYVKSPLYVGGPWATQVLELQATTLARSDAPVPAIRVGADAKLALGSEAKWHGARLVVPVSRSDVFYGWVATAWEGAIVFPAGNRGRTSFGVVRKLSAAVDNSALYMDIDWVAGEKPTSGEIAMALIHEIRIDPESRLTERVFWSDPGAMEQIVPHRIAAAGARPFPAAYPAAEYGFGR